MKRAPLVAVVALVLGCGSKVPPLSSQAQGMVKKFQQQMPNHRVPTFEQLCAQVEKMHSDKQLTDEEFNALHDVCGPASQGQWDRAEEALKPLVEATTKKKE